MFNMLKHTKIESKKHKTRLFIILQVSGPIGILIPDFLLKSFLFSASKIQDESMFIVVLFWSKQNIVLNIHISIKVFRVILSIIILEWIFLFTTQRRERKSKWKNFLKSKTVFSLDFRSFFIGLFSWGFERLEEEMTWNLES